MVDAQTISIVFAGISIGLAAIYYALNIRGQRETRQAQLFMQVYNQWTAGKYREWNEIRRWEFDEYDDFQKMIDDLESRNKFSSVTQFLEGLGVLVREGLIPIRLVSLYITTLVRIYWEKFGPMIEEYRERENIPRAAGEAEYLYRTVMKYVEEHPELKT